MPTPKGTGAPLAPISLISPGKYGLNKQQESQVLSPEWATEAYNCVFDVSGRLTARKGWLTATTTPMTSTPIVDVIHEYIRADSTRTIVSAAGSKLWLGVAVPSDITGTSTVTAGDNWQFFNFADVCIGVQQGEQPIRYTGTGTFIDLVESAGTAPKGNCGIGAFGRVWIADSDRQTIKYSNLLAELDWTGGDAGVIDMTSVWPNGMDEVVALAAYNGSLIVFGRNTIVFWRDSVGSALGIDPATMGVVDTIIGTGCVARDSVQQIDNGDILFLSSNGIQSLQRLIQNESNPILNVSMNIRDYMLGLVQNETTNEIRTIYAPKEGFYLLILPNSRRVFCFDTRVRLPDGSYRVTEWATRAKAGCRANDNTIYLSLANVGGHIGTYTSYNDRDDSNEAISYNFTYNSGWLDLGEEAASYLKMLKTINGIVYAASIGNSMNVSWDFDFSNTPDSFNVRFNNSGANSEWGIMEWGIGEWNGGGGLERFNVPASGTGQFIKVGINAPVDQNTFAIAQINLYAKIGRLAN